MTKVAGTKISNIETDLDGFKKSYLSNYVKDNEFTLLKGGVNITQSIVDELKKNYLKKSNLTGYAKKTEVANDITTIKNDYATNVSVDSKINDLKTKHISDEV